MLWESATIVQLVTYLASFSQSPILSPSDAEAEYRALKRDFNGCLKRPKVVEETAEMQSQIDTLLSKKLDRHLENDELERSV